MRNVVSAVIVACVVRGVVGCVATPTFLASTIPTATFIAFYVKMAGTMPLLFFCHHSHCTNTVGL